MGKALQGIQKCEKNELVEGGRTYVGSRLILSQVHSILIDLCRRPWSLSSIQKQIQQGTKGPAMFCTAAGYVKGTLFRGSVL